MEKIVNIRALGANIKYFRGIQHVKRGWLVYSIDLLYNNI